MTAPGTVRIEFPEWSSFLDQPARYKVMHSGRGPGKSWNVARKLLLRGVEAKRRILCTREMQNSIADSVHHLLEEQISDMKLRNHYQVQKATIIGANGTEFAFAGLRNIDNLKSFEGCDICWVEEAQTVTKKSWEKLIPTIRKEGSEIWVTFNPELDTDETYTRFVVHPPPNAEVRRLHWYDNPWFPEVLKAEMAHMKATDEEAYSNVWLGNPRSSVHGAIYAKELARADAEGRISRVPYDATQPVHTAWDLGFGDMVSIWMFQAFGFEYHFVDYEEGTGNAIPYYLRKLQERPYVWGTDWLPWDGGAKTLGTGKSIQELMQAAGRSVRVVPRLSVTDGINATRTLFPQCWFDADKCEYGIRALRRYCWDEDSEGERKREPKHNDASHPADAMRTAAVAAKQPKKAGPPPPPKPVYGLPNGPSWMG